MPSRNAKNRQAAGCGTGLLHRMRDALASRSGAAALEFGFALPVFLLFVFGTIEFGRVLWSEHALGYAAEQAARFAVANPSATTGEIQSYAQNQLMTVKKSAVTVTVAQENLGGIDYLTVRLAYPYQAMLPLLPFDSLSLIGISRIPRDA